MLLGEYVKGSTTKGCQQDVLSPLLWSVVVDELFWGLSEVDYYAAKYADDIVILINKKFSQIVSEVLYIQL
jgi:hypothetical protein